MLKTKKQWWSSHAVMKRTSIIDRWPLSEILRYGGTNFNKVCQKGQLNRRFKSRVLNNPDFYFIKEKDKGF